MKLFITFIIGLLVFTSCDIETSGNGKLDGYWHLVKVDTLQTGGSLDLSNSKIFWSVQSNLLDMIDRQGDAGELLFTFEHKGDSLLLSNPYIPKWDGDDTPIDDVAKLRPFGINSLNQKFLIESLSGGKMMIKDDRLRLCFKKM